MHGEVTWDQFDRLIEAYAAASLFVAELRDLETRISRASADLLRYAPSFDDLTSVLATRSPTKELMTRRIAWAAQHVLRRRAWCVGSKVLTKMPGEQAFASPLLDQLHLLGYVSAGEQEMEELAGKRGIGVATAGTAGVGGHGGAAVRNEGVDEGIACPREEIAGDGASTEAGVDAGAAFEVPSFDKIDGLMVSAASDEVWVVKGCSYAQARRLSPELWVNSDRSSLFGLDDRFMSRLFVSRMQVRTLLAARDLVQISHPRLKVRACFLVLNDPGCSWHFQAHELTSARPRQCKESRVSLDRFPVLATHRQFAEQFSDGGLGFEGLPDWAGEDPVSSLPADRPTRSLLMLQELWGRQLNRPKRLSTSRGDELAASVGRTSGVSLPRDQWRHDLEDCLERGGFVRRMPDRPGRFAVTPKGVARLLVLRQKLEMKHEVPTAQLLSHVTHQSRLWASAPVT